MKKGKEVDFIVYEPVKRMENDRLEQEELNKCKKYAGLYNRGNTCYLNSLLQTLFMTPEFRKNIFNWKYNEEIHGQKEYCIPFQLQKLFARMQLKFRDCEVTEGLTKSFQWGYQELLEQHDIQELCRVFFEAIENSLYETEDNFINYLYQGCLTSIVQCLECKFESEITDCFLDMSLPIRDEYEKIYNSSLEMAFANFLKKEKLYGDNQYKCEKCKKKVDALKYLKLKKLPKILFLQLNRFEYDITTENRKKICDRITFPMLLNMNSFLKDYEDIRLEYDNEKLKKLAVREEVEFNEELIEHYRKEGDYVYELYAIMVHSGSARGGHYYCFIKSFEDTQWYRFDDTSVYEATKKNIEFTFGENTRSELNAVTGYILMYRQLIKEEKGYDFYTNIDNSIILQNKGLMDLIEIENILIKEEEEKLKEKLNSVQLKFIYNDKIVNIIEKKTSNVKELKLRVFNEYNLHGTVTLENIRIRCVNNNTYKFLDTYADEDKTLEETNIVSHKTYSLEIKKDSEQFEEYNPDIINIKLCKWIEDYHTQTIEEKDFIYDKIKIDKKLPMKELKNAIHKYYNIHDDSNLYIFHKINTGINNYDTIEFFTNEEELNKEINSYMLVDNSILFLEVKTEDWKESKFISFFEDNCTNIVVKFNLPIPIKNNKKPTKITVGSYKFDNVIEIKKSKNLRDLKKRISEVLNISENEFIIKKNTHNGVELKNLSERIDKYSSNVLNIYTEFGSPLKDSEIKINVFTCEYDFSFFLIFPYKTVDVGVFTVDLNWTIAELKMYLIEEFKKKSLAFTDLITDNLEEILIRDYKNDRPTTIFSNFLILGKELHFAEHKKIIVQKYKESMIEFSQGDIQLTVREWDPSDWKISVPYEVHFKKGTTFLDFNNKLNLIFNHIQPDKLSAYKVTNEMNVYMDDFKKFKFENLYEQYDFVVDHYPFFINTDGFILIVKDDTKIYREPLEDEIKFYCRPKLSTNKGKKPVSSISQVSNSSRSITKPLVNSFKREKESAKGVIIKVKKVEPNANKVIKENDNNINSETDKEIISKGSNECNNTNNDINGMEHSRNIDVMLINNISQNKKIEIEIYTKEFNDMNSNSEKTDYSQYDQVFKEK